LRQTVVAVPINRDEYFLIENRQVDVSKPDTIEVDVEDGVLIAIEGNEYDFFQPGSGLLIWHVDQAVIADYGPYNAINIDAARKGVDLEEADGVQDFDVPYWESWAPDYEIYGSPFDPFFKGGYNDEFSAETDPPSDGYSGKTFLRVSLLGEEDTLDRLKDTLVYVRIGWDLYQPGFPVSYEGRSVPFRNAFAVDLDGDSMLEVVVLDTMGRISAWRHDGTGYRLPTGAFAELTTSTMSDVAIGDITADPGLELVACGSDGTVRLFSKDGLSLGILRTGDRITAAPVLADLDGDGLKEVIVGSTDMRLYAFNGSFDTMPGFPVEAGGEIRAAVAVTDTTTPDIAVLTADGRLLQVGPDGSMRPGFPVVLSNVPYYNTGQPLVGDFDRDGKREIAVIAGSEFDNRLFIVGLDGAVEYRSQELVRQPYAGPMAAHDVNGDGYPDLLAASMNELFAFNRNATLVGNYPFRQDSTFLTYELAGNWIIYYDTYFQYASAPAVADLDGDGRPDIIIGSPRYGVLAFDHEAGDTLARFPLMTTAPVSAVPLVADLDRDGDVELCVGADDGIFHVWDLEGLAANVGWGCAYHDPCHTGLLLDDELGPIPDIPDGIVGSYFVYPNPAADEVVVRYRLNREVESVRVSLLDIAAEPTGIELDGPRLGNTDNELVLDLDGVDPGLYVVRLEATSTSGSVLRFAKLAVVR
ncbi:VCBS repeat-containing protein, partial [candidate division WOR-3 bacterium]|nr:VCBS repeat-containing protein [candidate division WOR-3 bacterium]